MLSRSDGDKNFIKMKRSICVRQFSLKTREIDWCYVWLQQFDKFWIWRRILKEAREADLTRTKISSKWRDRFVCASAVSKSCFVRYERPYSRGCCAPAVVVIQQSKNISSSVGPNSKKTRQKLQIEIIREIDWCYVHMIATIQQILNLKKNLLKLVWNNY